METYLIYAAKITLFVVFCGMLFYTKIFNLNRRVILSSDTNNYIVYQISEVVR